MPAQLTMLVSASCAVCAQALALARHVAEERPDILVTVVGVDEPGWRPPRTPHPSVAQQVPILTRTPTGVNLAHLDVRPGTRPRLRDFLALPYQAAGLAPGPSQAAADTLIDAILTATAAFYDALTAAAAPPAPTGALGQPDAGGAADIHSMITAVASLQRAGLAHWGR